MPIPVLNNSCPLCKFDQFWRIPFNKNGIDKSEERLQYYEWRLCKRCANAYPLPEPTLAELQTYWDQNRVETSEQQVTDQVWQAREAQDLLWAQRAYDFVKPYVSQEQRTYLDVACGLGATVECFQSHGWDAEGIDADPNTKKFHLKRHIRSRIGQIENIEELVKFDLISICHAIYFITEPLRFISRVKQLLNSRGLFLIILSDFNSTLSSGQPGFAHTWYPTQHSLNFLLIKEGFEIVASKKIRGSILILARTADSTESLKFSLIPFFTYLTHLSQRARFRYLGQPLLVLLKKIQRLFRRATN
jgi:2-polyprenyl-3-methyl-5-hydroxy-6-metoxy-1,4-benzoquinol methylase